jgi:RNA polymerase sigma-70 factor (ECF subfamily)
MWDSEIRRRLTYGDQDALVDVYDRYSRSIYAIALSVTREPEVAENIAADAFTTLWNRPLAFDPSHASIRGWLAMLAHRGSVEWLRRNNSAAGNQRASIERVVELAYFTGRTYRQIAAQLGIPESTVKSRLRAGLRQLAADVR